MTKRRFIPRTVPFLHSVHILIVVMSWITLIYTIVQVHPNQWQSLYYAPFFGLLFATLFFTLFLFTKKVVISLVIPLGCITILLLRLFGIKDWANPILIIALMVTLIYFFTAKDDRDTLPQSTSNNQTTSADPDKT